MRPLERNNVVVSGHAGGPCLVFVHGFGCDQTMWRQITGGFESDHRIVTYDLTGMGRSDLSAYDFERYARLEAHAEDLVSICAALDLEDAVIVGHSIGASIAVLAANRAPDLISQLVLVSPTPSFLDYPDSGYHGGFSRAELESLVAFLDENHLGWSREMAPRIAGQEPGDPAADELSASFCRTDPEIATHFGRVTFLADCRDEMARASRPSLILHCDEDALVPMSVADWMRDHIPGGQLRVLRAKGHCPHMTVPEDVITAMRAYLRNT